MAMPDHAPRGRALFGAEPTRWSALVPVVAALAGILFAMSFLASRGIELRSLGRDLPSQIREINRAVEAKSRQVAALQAQIDSLTSDLEPSNSELATLANKADALGIPAGSVPVTGPSVTVALDDSPRAVSALPPGITADDIVVHQQDVQGVVNALWANGAEAMMIQDQRIISTSAVRCVGNTLILQGRVYSPPYVIAAVGDTRSMLRGLDADPAVSIYRQYVDAVGLGYEVSVSASTTLPAYAGALTLQRAVPGT